MKRLLVGLAFACLVLSPSTASADTSTTDPQQQLALINQIRAQLGSNLADALAAQQQLRQSLQDNAAQQAVLQGKIADVLGIPPNNVHVKAKTMEHLGIVGTEEAIAAEAVALVFLE